ncbi:hypothetical protein HRbin01_01761 [archaeon HR01]|nr:hypothetical protein HRbin01_01761 [archaeon HR01]
MIYALFIILLMIFGFSSALTLHPSVEGPGVFAFLDRMVYDRPADVTVFGIVLDENNRPVENANISVDVFDPDGDLLYSKELSTDSNGKFMTQFRLSASSPEGEYTVLVSDIDGVYGDITLLFEVCKLCVIPPSIATTTVFRTTTSISTAIRTVTMLETQTGVQVFTVTTFLNGSEVTVVVTKTLTVAGSSDSTYLYYIGLGMVVVLAVASAIVARRVGSRGVG